MYTRTVIITSVFHIVIILIKKVELWKVDSLIFLRYKCVLVSESMFSDTRKLNLNK